MASGGENGAEAEQSTREGEGEKEKEQTDWRAERQRLRNANAQCEGARPSDAQMKQLDGSLKRNNAMTRKLRSISDSNRHTILTELHRLNMSKYLDEAVQSVAEGKLRAADISAAVAIVSSLHQTYSSFTSMLAPKLAKLATGGCSLETGEPLSANQRKVKLRLLAELVLVGAVDDASLLVHAVKDLCSATIEPASAGTGGGAHLAVAASFSKHCVPDLLEPQHRTKPANAATDTTDSVGIETNSSEYDGTEWYEDKLGGPTDEELAADPVLSHDHRSAIYRALHSCFEHARSTLIDEHCQLENAEREAAKQDELRGDDSAMAAHERERRSFEQLWKNVSMLAEGIGQEMPHITDQSQRFDEEQQAESGSQANAQEDLPLWQDDETREFYEQLVHMSEVISPALLRSKREEDTSDAASAEQDGGEADGGESQQWQQSDPQPQQQASQSGKVKEKPPNADRLFSKLPKCTAKESADQFSVEFAKIATRSMRKRLMKELLNVPLKELQLVPFYARIAANVSQVFKDVGQGVVSSLEENFNQQIARKDQIDLESKLRTARFLAELCKFGIASSQTIFACLKQCYDDFTHHNVDVACALLETCGRYLCRLKSTATRAKNNVDILMRLKNAKNLDSRQSSIVDNAYYTCRPPLRRKARRRKGKQELYVEHLLYAVLERRTVERVVAQMRKLSWSELGEDLMVQKFLDAAVMGRTTSVPAIALVVAGLSRFRDSFSVALVDDLLERVRGGLEHETPSMSQERVAHMRLLAELFRAKLVPPRLVVDCLYTVLFFGHYEGGNGHVVDPPTHTFRARLVITALQSCAKNLDTGKARTRVERLLAHFWRYLMYKEHLPSQIKFDAHALVASLRPYIAKSQSVEDAEDLCNKLDARADAEEAQSLNQADDNDDAGANEIDEAAYDADEVSEDENGGSGDEGGVDLDSIDDAIGAHRTAERRHGVSEQEEREFEEELNNVMQELGGVANASKRRELNTGRHAASTVTADIDGEPHDDEEDDEDSMVQFKLLTRSKQQQHQPKSIRLPSSSSFAQAMKQQQAQEIREREELKNLTLGLTLTEDDP